MKKSKIVFEVATMAAFAICFGRKRNFNVDRVLSRVIEGYEKHLELSVVEKDCVTLSMIARLVCYICSATSLTQTAPQDKSQYSHVMRMYDAACWVLRYLCDSYQFLKL